MTLLKLQESFTAFTGTPFEKIALILRTFVTQVSTSTTKIQDIPPLVPHKTKTRWKR